MPSLISGRTLGGDGQQSRASMSKRTCRAASSNRNVAGPNHSPVAGEVVEGVKWIVHVLVRTCTEHLSSTSEIQRTASGPFCRWTTLSISLACRHRLPNSLLICVSPWRSLTFGALRTQMHTHTQGAALAFRYLNDRCHQ